MKSGRQSSEFPAAVASKRVVAALRAMLVCAALAGFVVATGCADDTAPAPSTGEYGVFRFALNAAVPGATHMKVHVYIGPAKSKTGTPKYALDCVAYIGADGTIKNPFTLDKLPARNDYSVMVELFGDDACTKPLMRAYRGGIVVEPIGLAEAAANPYYLQPSLLGSFTGMAVASAEARATVEKRSCTSDAECASAHPAALCESNKCRLDSLFPLNGGARRGLPATTALSDGRIALHGCVSVASAGAIWASTSQRVEVFDPKLGRFEHPAAEVAGFEEAARVALASASNGDGAAFYSAGGSARVVIAREGTKLRTGLDDGTCNSPSDCPIGDAVWRVDVSGKSSTSAKLSTVNALPIVANVLTADGPRLYVAGGAAVPLPKSGDPRAGNAVLCKLDGKTAACDASAALMVAGRANAATLCLDTTDVSASGCRRLLLLGGRSNKAAPLGEIFNANKDAMEAVEIAPGLNPEQIHGGHLVRPDDTPALRLGATAAPLFLDPAAVTTPNALAPLLITIDESTATTRLSFAEAPLGSFGGSDGGKRALGAAVALPEGGALLAGGVGANGAILGDAIVFDATCTASARLSLEKPRYGAALQVIPGEGPFGGCAMLVGGFGAPATGARISRWRTSRSTAASRSDGARPARSRSLARAGLLSCPLVSADDRVARFF